MTSEIPQNKEDTKEKFNTDQVLTIVGGHFIHDSYTSFVAPLLPLIIEKLSLTLTMAGSFNSIDANPRFAESFHWLPGR